MQIRVDKLVGVVDTLNKDYGDNTFELCYDGDSLIMRHGVVLWDSLKDNHETVGEVLGHIKQKMEDKG